MRFTSRLKLSGIVFQRCVVNCIESWTLKKYQYQILDVIYDIQGRSAGILNHYLFTLHVHIHFALQGLETVFKFCQMSEQILKLNKFANKLSGNSFEKSRNRPQLKQLFSDFQTLRRSEAAVPHST